MFKQIAMLSVLILGLNSASLFAFGERMEEMADKIGESIGVGKTAAEIDQSVDGALQKLFQSSSVAKQLASTAKAVLVFPEILKAGVGVGGQHGEGALRVNGKTSAYYSLFAGSYGLQLGAQKFGYAMFFMDEIGLNYLSSSDGWEVGVGPSVVLVDEGVAKTLSTTTAKESIYVFTFAQKGLMAGAGIQGSKISRIKPKK
jgi:lipid-binding SYLF domain-containing protein